MAYSVFRVALAAAALAAGNADATVTMSIAGCTGGACVNTALEPRAGVEPAKAALAAVQRPDRRVSSGPSVATPPTAAYPSGWPGDAGLVAVIGLLALALRFVPRRPGLPEVAS
jgi:hypothetical protein